MESLKQYINALFRYTAITQPLLQRWLSQIPNSCLLCGQDAQKILCHSCLNALVYQGHNVCLHCGLALPTFSTQHCGQCLMQTSAYQRLYAALAYAGTGKALLKKAKYSPHHGLSALRQLGDILIQQIQLQDPEQIDVIIPVPLHPKRLRQRGYHQTLILAKRLSQHYHIPVDHHCCQIKNVLRNQTYLSVQQRTSDSRRKQLEQNFSIAHGAKRWNRVLLVDDVITTGSTIEALASNLKQAGVKHIDVCSCMRTHSQESLLRLLSSST